ncbi:MAG: carbohydrate kinase [Anaerolineae bacterium]|nr:carbohydrate kinase [Anaerolineae bacterium]
MDEQRLWSLLEGFPERHVLVVGDYFLDLYLDLDRTLSEVSLETGLEAYQVARVRSSPGAAGTVTSNLRALNVQVTALGAIGDDGMGYELLRGLRQRGVDVGPLLQVAGRFTPTYTKPMMAEPDGRVHELNRLDIKNRDPMPAGVEERIVRALCDLAGEVDGIVVADQVQERNCGVVSDRVRAALSELAQAHPALTVVADSRARVGEFRHVMVKPNAREAVQAIRAERSGEDVDRETVVSCGRALCARTGRPVYVTVGAEGALVFDRTGMTHVPGIRVEGPIDIVGAGDSTMAGIVSALCCGATPVEAALVGNLVASLTIQQLGTTGTATRGEVMQRYRDVLRPA